VAALASLGTSASPQPPPALTDTTTGTIEVTAENPVATVDVSITANAALRSAPMNSTEVAIGATSASGGMDPAKATTLTTIEALDGQPAVSTDAFPSLKSFMDGACGPGECTRRYRITVVLTDPEADRARFDWAASASSRFGAGGGTGSPPPDARLEVTAEPAVLVPAERLTRVSVTPAPVRVDAGHPRTAVTYELTRPRDAATFGDSSKLVLRLEGEEGDVNVMDRPATLLVHLGDVQVATTQLRRRLQLVPITLPTTCDDPGGCVEPLTFQFDWEGGDLSNVIDQAWSVTGVAIAAKDGPAAPLSFGPDSRTALSTDDPHLTATTSGTFDIGRDNSTFLDATVTLDASELGQGLGGVRGAVQGILTATSTPEGGTPKTEVRIVVEERGAVGQPGEPLAAAGRLVPLDCEGRSRCEAVLPFGASMGYADPVDVHVEWTLTVVFLPDPPGSLPPDVELLLETAPRPTP
jgi:hypothetical protein